MENKKCRFYDYDKKTKIKIQYYNSNKQLEGYEAPIFSQKVKLVAWLKRSGCFGAEEGITILNKGCIPIPNWITS